MRRAHRLGHAALLAGTSSVMMHRTTCQRNMQCKGLSMSRCVSKGFKARCRGEEPEDLCNKDLHILVKVLHSKSKGYEARVYSCHDNVPCTTWPKQRLCLHCRDSLQFIFVTTASYSS